LLKRTSLRLQAPAARFRTAPDEQRNYSWISNWAEQWHMFRWWTGAL